MQNVIRADDIKPDFEGLKNKWEEMLQKYYIDANMLDPKYTLEIPCPHCGSEHTDNKFFLNGFSNYQKDLLNFISELYLSTNIFKSEITLN